MSDGEKDLKDNDKEKDQEANKNNNEDSKETNQGDRAEFNPNKPNQEKQEHKIFDKLNDIKQKLTEKDNQINEYKDRYMRIAAEFDNYKRRTQNDISNARNNGKIELIRSILPIIDEFELAIIAAEKSSDKTVQKGIEMVYTNFMKTLSNDGLMLIPTEGKYDPYLDEILMVKESDQPDGTIIETITKGYKFNDAVIRPASVIISGKPNKSDKSLENNTDNSKTESENLDTKQEGNEDEESKDSDTKEKWNI